MLQSVANICIGLKVEHPIAALERRTQQRRVKDVPLAQSDSGRGRHRLDELPPPRAKVIDDDHLDAICTQAVGEIRANEPGAAGDTCSFHLRFRG